MAPPSMTQEEFIKRANEIHNNKYCYDETIYVDSKTKVKIICKIHGPFTMDAGRHIRKTQFTGCSICSKESQRLSRDEFIKRANEIHNNRYNYDEMEYINTSTNIKVRCNLHGIFILPAHRHIRKVYPSGCRDCSKISTESFIKRATEIHEGKYDYSRTIYVDQYTKILIGCPIHGDFNQYPGHHIYDKIGCASCNKDEQTNINKKKFITRSKEFHNDFYDYEQVKFITKRIKVKIKCPVHGFFWQAPENHLVSGCAECGEIQRRKLRRLTTDSFIKKAKKIHGDRYDYSKTNYIDHKTDVIIICNKHGEFLQKPTRHFNTSGCLRCAKSNYSQASIKCLEYISKRDNIFIQHAENLGEYKIKDTNFRADGFCKELNIITEYNGCKFHGCCICFPDRTKINDITGEQFEVLYNNTIKREQIIKNKGYHLIVIWEHEFRAMLKSGLKPHMYFDDEIANFAPDELSIAISYDLELCNTIKKIRNFLKTINIEFHNIDKDNVLNYLEETKQLFNVIYLNPEIGRIILKLIKAHKMN
jgi:hypothetical protein